MDSTPEYMERKESNTLGLVGFILSFTCCLSPLALLLCLIAVFRPPRGLAIAGLIISGLITASLGASYYKFDQLSREHGLGGVMSAGEYFVDSVRLAGELQKRLQTKGTLPADLDDLTKDDGMKTDPWGESYRLVFIGLREFENQGEEFNGAFYALRSAGPDGEWGTKDDILPGIDTETFFGMVWAPIPKTFDLSTLPAVEGDDATHEPAGDDENK